MTHANISNTLPRTYRELVDILAPRPIHTDSEYEEVASVVDRLAVLNRRTKDQDDYLDALCRFIQDYDEEHNELPDATPLQVLRHLVERHGLSANKLG